MKYLDTKPQSLEETIVKLRAEKDMNGMRCKNCGDMFGKPTAESSCQYNAYNPMGENWVKKESYKEEVELDEKRGPDYQLYHKTFSGAMQHAYAVAKKRGYTVDKDDIDNKVAIGPKKPSSGKTNRYILGTDKKKDLHIQVANLDNKRYELNMYIESVKEVELDEIRMPYVVVDTANNNEVIGTTSDEMDAKLMIASAERPPISIKNKKTLKIVKSRKKQTIGLPLKEEVELDEVTNEKGDLNTAADDFEKAAGKQLMDKAKFLKIAALLRKGDTKAVAKIAKSSSPKSRLAIGDYMADNIGPKKASKLLGFRVESVELDEAKVECPECEGKGCDHCDDKGYHMKEGFIIESEDIDPQIKRLFRMGLVNKDEMQKALRAFKNPEKSMQNKELRAVMMKVLQKVLKTVENDPSLFQKMKGSLKNVSETIIDEKLDPVNKKEVKKDFDDRKDKDIDNDGDVDDSDEYLHKKRKAISKAMKKEERLQKINDRIKENKAKYDGRTREGKSFVERITNNRLKREEKKKGNENQEKKTMTDKPANNIKIHGSYK